MGQTKILVIFIIFLICSATVLGNAVFAGGDETTATPEPYRLTPLEQAIDSDDLSKIKALIDSGVDVNMPSDHPSGITPLHRAIHNENLEIINLLLDSGVDLEAKDTMLGCTPLHWAAGYCPSMILELLLNRGAKVDSLDAMGETPLFLATAEDRVNNAELLIKYGANVHHHATHPGTGRCTALHNAALFGSEGVLKILMENGADPDVRTEEGSTPLHWAVTEGQYGTALELINNNAGVNARDSNGNTPLHYAVDQGHPNLVRLLLDHGADRTLENNCGHTPVALTRGRAFMKFPNYLTISWILSFHD